MSSREADTARANRGTCGLGIGQGRGLTMVPVLAALRASRARTLAEPVHRITQLMIKHVFANLDRPSHGRLLRRGALVSQAGGVLSAKTPGLRTRWIRLQGDYAGAGPVVVRQGPTDAVGAAIDPARQAPDHICTLDMDMTRAPLGACCNCWRIRVPQAGRSGWPRGNRRGTFGRRTWNGPGSGLWRGRPRPRDFERYGASFAPAG